MVTNIKKIIESGEARKGGERRYRPRGIAGLIIRRWNIHWYKPGQTNTITVNRKASVSILLEKPHSQV